MSYRIKLDQFEGPLDLLLELIEQEKLDITRVSLAKIADQYLDFIENEKNVSLSNLAEFLWVASRLILIKSKALLPLLQLSEEEEEDIHDLEWQLAEYKKFKDSSKILEKMINARQRGYSRESLLGVKEIFYPPKNITAVDLKNVFEGILVEIPVAEKFEEKIMDEVVSLEDKISHLKNFLIERIETSFSEVVAGSEDKVEVIVSFLAMLEMVKQRVVLVEQGDIFGEIKLKNSQLL